jgi:hypothetical protein
MLVDLSAVQVLDYTITINSALTGNVATELTYDLNYGHVSNNVVSYSNMQGSGFFYTHSIIRAKVLGNTFNNVGFYNENLLRVANPDMADPIVNDDCGEDYTQDGSRNDDSRGMFYLRLAVDLLVE